MTTNSIPGTNKVRENRLRRAAQRQGLRLDKSKLRDPNARGYGLYALIDTSTGHTMHASALWGIHTLDLDDVETKLDVMRSGSRPLDYFDE